MMHNTATGTDSPDPTEASPALEAEWTAFLRALDTLYEELAALRGQPFHPTPSEQLATAARAAAAAGLRPTDVYRGGTLWPADFGGRREPPAPEHGTVAPPHALLVPLDGSTAGEMALAYIRPLARATGLPVHLLAVREPAGPSAGQRGPAAEPDHFGPSAADPAAYLARLADQLCSLGLPATSSVVRGHPVREILDVAERSEATLVALATSGEGGASAWRIGRVADKVMRLNARPTLLLRAPAAARSWQEWPITLRRLLVTLDGSLVAEDAIPVAGELARVTGMAVVLVRVIEHHPLVLTGEQAQQRAAAYLADVQRRLPAGCPVECTVLHNGAGPALVNAVHARHIDLVLMTTQGHGRLRPGVLGSTADYLVRSGVPTLLVPPSSAVATTAPATLGDADPVGAERPAPALTLAR